MLPISDIVDDLTEKGWAVRENFFPSALMRLLHDDLHDDALKRAGIGRAAARAEDIRTDSTRWLTGATGAQQEFLSLMDRLRLALNRDLFLGLRDYEAHYALYEPGGFYKKHIDALRGAKNRVVSTVTYLTPDWAEIDGGHLVLYAPDDENREIARILPCAGTLAVFLSEEIPHEVLPPARARASIAGWFRVNSVV